MKNLLKILPLIPLCLACSSDNEDIEPVEQMYNIGFCADIAETRAIADISDLQAGGFSVWGGFQGQQVFDGRKVTYQSGAWGYENPEVWTFNDYTFHAIYPSADAGAYTSATATNNNQQFDIKGFDAASGNDLLHATAVGIDGSTTPVVNLSFKHTLTSISVELNKHTDNAEDKITVTQVYIIGMYTKGDYQWKNEGGTITAAWTLDSDQEIANAGSTFTEELNTTPYKSFLTDILVMPQAVDPVNHPVGLIVVYDFAITGGETITNNILFAYLPADPAWEINKKITYKATINAQKDITFATPTVEEWGTQHVGGTTIIK